MNHYDILTNRIDDLEKELARLRTLVLFPAGWEPRQLVEKDFNQWREKEKEDDEE